MTLNKNKPMLRMRFCLGAIVLLFSCNLCAQTVLKGKIISSTDNEPLIGATIVNQAKAGEGAQTDFDGSFEFKISTGLPVNLIVSYLGFQTKTITVGVSNKIIEVRLEEDAVKIADIEITGQRISDKQKESPLTIETMDLLAIKSTPSENFYDGLGSMKGVDLTAASLGFKVINMRGFNSTSPVRSLQLIDGVDNQAPGLNFSLGNFLGRPELDVIKVDLVQGASSAFYGPNAFNGVISIETKNPFYHKGLAVSMKVGERDLFETAFRYADVLNNSKGEPLMGYKFNFSFLSAYDWVADNNDATDGSEAKKGNPGGWDRVNTYGDEEYSLNKATSGADLLGNRAGLGIWHRTGYRELDLVDYTTRNIKGNINLHFRTNPSKLAFSPEFIVSSSFGSGTTVYQGDNRFRLKNILFFQNKLEYSLKDKYFIRAYATNEDAGQSYDPYFTALILQRRAKSDQGWSTDYSQAWAGSNHIDEMRALGYPTGKFNPTTGQFEFDEATALAWIQNNQALLTQWHQEAAQVANTKVNVGQGFIPFFEPGTDRFKQEFNQITSTNSNKKDLGTRFFDRSSLYHLQGEYKFEPTWTDYILVGGNYRLYTPNSRGTIFYDTAGTKITNSEFGVYSGIQKKFDKGKWITTATLRMDKNENFDYIFTPAASIVYSPSANNYFRISLSSALRNPTLTDQFLFLNVGRAILAGNQGGVDSLITVESFVNYLNTQSQSGIRFFNIAALKPERVQTLEAGYRTTLFQNIYLDAGYYFSRYTDFLGYNIGIKSDIEFGPVFSVPQNTQAYRYAANSVNNVNTQGANIGLSYYFSKYYSVTGNYSWNQLVKTNEDDPIIPAFNTPEHKYNLGMTARDIPWLKTTNKIGFGANWKWVEGFVFEGSPQFTGFIPSYGLFDAQINFNWSKMNTIFKLGGSNLLENLHYETYGGPLIGRLLYFSVTYDFKKS